jgi:serine/threonine-protein kinase
MQVRALRAESHPFMSDPKTLGKYEITGVLGKGAMGVVYSGIDKTFQRRRDVAIKTIRKSQLTDLEMAEEYSRRFEREAEIGFQLNHPNIVRAFEYSIEGDISYLVMEMVRGQELKQYFDQGNYFNLPVAIRLMTELLEALDHAHQHGIVHRDVKPANILIEAQGRLKLTDFGVARVSENTEGTRTGTKVGTTSYMAPEQIQGLAINQRADIFAAGIVLYQFLTHQKPFTGSEWELQNKIVRETAPPPSTIRSDAPPIFDAIVAKALAKLPGDRFASAQEFADALQQALAEITKQTSVGDSNAADDEPTMFAPPVAAGSGAKAGSRGQAADSSSGQRSAPSSGTDNVSRPSGAGGVTGMTGSSSGKAPSEEAEIEFWRSIKDSSDPEDYEFYINKFPYGTYVDLARRRIAKYGGSSPQETSGVTDPERAAEHARKAEEEHLAAEQARQAEERRLAAEKASKAEEQRVAATRAREAEAERLAAEKARKAEEERLAAERARKAEHERLAADMAKKAEEERLAAEGARKAEQARLAAEKANKAEEERLAAEKARKAEEERLAAERAKKAEAERIAAEKAKKAEEQRLAAEKAKKAEEDRLLAEKARKAEELRLAAEKAEKAEQERIAAKKAEQDRIAAAKAKKAEEERLAAESAKKAKEERIAEALARHTQKAGIAGLGGDAGSNEGAAAAGAEAFQDVRLPASRTSGGTAEPAKKGLPMVPLAIAALMVIAGIGYFGFAGKHAPVPGEPASSPPAVAPAATQTEAQKRANEEAAAQAKKAEEDRLAQQARDAAEAKSKEEASAKQADDARQKSAAQVKKAEDAKTDKAERERIATEKAVRERIEKEKADRDRIEREKADKKRNEKDKSDKDRIEKEKADKDRIEKEKADKERIEREKAEKDRIEKERARKPEMDGPTAKKLCEQLKQERPINIKAAAAACCLAIKLGETVTAIGRCE